MSCFCNNKRSFRTQQVLLFSIKPYQKNPMKKKLVHVPSFFSIILKSSILQCIDELIGCFHEFISYESTDFFREICLLTYCHVNFGCSEKAPKFERISHLKIDIAQQHQILSGRFFSNFVLLSKSSNFTWNVISFSWHQTTKPPILFSPIFSTIFFSV